MCLKYVFKKAKYVLKMYENMFLKISLNFNNYTLRSDVLILFIGIIIGIVVFIRCNSFPSVIKSTSNIKS